MKKKVLSAAAGIVMIASLLAGCGGSSADNQKTPEQTAVQEENTAAEGTEASADNTAAQDKPYAGTKLTVGVEAGAPNIAFYQKEVAEFTEQTGIEVEWVEIPHDNMHERFVQEAISGSGAIDIYDTDQPWISEFASRGYLTDLTDKLTEEDKNDFYAAALDASSYEGKIYSVPFFVHTPIVFYRTDLFEAAGITEFPKTWEEYADAAKKLTAGDVYGTIIEAKQAGEPVTHLVDWFYQAGGSIVDAQNNVTVNSAENKAAFDYLLGMMYDDESVMPGSLGYDNADVHNMFMQGKVAMVKNWPYMYAMCKDPSQSTVSDRFAVAVQPAGKNQSTAAWTWGFGISSSSKNQEAAWEFVKWATSSEKLAGLGIANSNPVPRTSSLEIVKNDTSLSEFDIQSIQVMSEALNYASNATENPNFPSIQTELSYTLSAIMSKQTTVEDGLKAAEERIQEILQQ